MHIGVTRDRMLSKLAVMLLNAFVITYNNVGCRKWVRTSMEGTKGLIKAVRRALTVSFEHLPCGINPCTFYA